VRLWNHGHGAGMAKQAELSPGSPPDGDQPWRARPPGCHSATSAQVDLDDRVARGGGGPWPPGACPPEGARAAQGQQFLDPAAGDGQSARPRRSARRPLERTESWSVTRTSLRHTGCGGVGHRARGGDGRGATQHRHRDVAAGAGPKATGRATLRPAEELTSSGWMKPRARRVTSTELPAARQGLRGGTKVR